MRFLAPALCAVLLASAAQAHTHTHDHAARPATCSFAALYDEAMQRMHAGMDVAYTGDADVDFAYGMIPHHEGAVDMAKIQLKYGKDPVLRTLAERIIMMQKVEIGEMRRWLYVRGYLPRVDAPSPTGKARASNAPTREFQHAMEAMHHGMPAKHDTDPDVDFILGMIPHHQGAIDMAQVQLRHGKNLDLSRLSENIIRSQSAEIALMRARLRYLQQGN